MALPIELSITIHCMMTTREERIQAKMAAIIAAKEVLHARQKVTAKEQEEQEYTKELLRIAKEAFDRAQKEAVLAAIPLDTLIVWISELQTYCTKYGDSYILNSGLSPTGKADMEKQLRNMSAKLIDYEWELNRRRAIDEATVEERIINAPIEKQKNDEELKRQYEEKNRRKWAPCM
jgi:hypothetical protein